MSAEAAGVEWKLRAERIFAYTRLLTYILNNPGESRGFWVNFRSKVTGSLKLEHLLDTES